MIYQIDDRPAAILWDADGVDDILSRAKNLLMTRRGEVCYDALRGLDPELESKPVGWVNDRIASAADALMSGWNPDVNVRWARCAVDAETGGRVITLGLEIRDDAM